MNTLTSLLLLFFIGLSVAAPVIYELDGSFEDADFKRGAPVKEDEVTGWDVTGEFEVTSSSTGGDWTDDSEGTTGDDGQMDGGFTTTGNSPATTGSGNSVVTTGSGNAPVTTGRTFPAGTTGKNPPHATTGIRVTTGAAEPGKKVVLIIGLVVDETTYTPAGFQKGINKIMDFDEDAETIVITSTGKRSLTVNFYFIVAGAEEKTYALVAMVSSDDPKLRDAGFEIYDATVSEATVEDPATTGAVPPPPNTTTGANVEEEEGKGLSDGAIAGIVIGVIVVVVVVVGVAMFMLMRKKNKATRVIPA